MCVCAAEVILDKDTGRSRGFGFVTLKTEEDADSACNDMNETVSETMLRFN